MHSWKVIQHFGVEKEKESREKGYRDYSTWKIITLPTLLVEKPHLILTEIVLISLWWSKDLRKLCRWPALQRTALSGLHEDTVCQQILDGPWISASISSQAKFSLADECMCEVAGVYQTNPWVLFHGITCDSSVHPFVFWQETPSKWPYLSAILATEKKKDLMTYQISYSVITAMTPFTPGLRHINRVLWESKHSWCPCCTGSVKKMLTAVSREKILPKVALTSIALGFS